MAATEGYRRYKYMVIVLNIFVFLLGALLLSLGIFFQLESGFLSEDVVDLFNEIEYNSMKFGTLGRAVLLGALLLSLGIFFQLESGFLSEDVVDLFNEIEYNSMKFGTLGRAVVFTMIAVGGCLVLIAVLGMVAAWKMIRWCLILFVMILVFLILCQFVVCGFWLNIRSRTDQWLRGQFLDLLKVYRGPTETDVVSKGFNRMFVDATCCGVSDQYKNGGTNNDFEDVSSTWSAGTTEKVPATCCQGVSLGTATTYISSTCTTTPKNFYTKGCYEKLSENVNTYSLVIVIACGVVFFLQVAAIVAACLVMDTAKNKIRQARLAKRPPPYVGIDTVLRNRESRQQN